MRISEIMSPTVDAIESARTSSEIVGLADAATARLHRLPDPLNSSTGEDR